MKKTLLLALLLAPVLPTGCGRRAAMHQVIEGTAGLTMQTATDLIQDEIERSAIRREVWVNIGRSIPTKDPGDVAPGTSYADFVDFVKKTKANKNAVLYLNGQEWLVMKPMLTSGTMITELGETPSLEVRNDIWHLFVPTRYFATAIVEKDGLWSLKLCEIGDELSEIVRITPDGADLALVEFKAQTDIEKTVYAGLFGGLPQGAECLAAPRTITQEFTLKLGRNRWVVAGSQSDQSDDQD